MRLSPALVTLAALAVATAAAAQPVRVALDQETVIGGVGVACTGIGQTKNDPKWLAYGVRVEFADASSNYLAGEDLTLSGSGGEILSISCEGPWVLLKLPAGQAYQVQARVTQGGVQPRTATVKAPSHGQTRVVLTFPDAH
jgi:hypothetical protein